MRKLFVAVFFLLAAFPTSAAKEDDVTLCVLPVHASWMGKSLKHIQLGKPPQPGEFLMDLKVDLREGDSSIASSGTFQGYVGVTCGTPDAVKLTFHHSVLGGWQAK